LNFDILKGAILDQTAIDDLMEYLRPPPPPPPPAAAATDQNQTDTGTTSTPSSGAAEGSTQGATEGTNQGDAASTDAKPKEEATPLSSRKVSIQSCLDIFSSKEQLTEVLLLH
jgi:hypothetical protein